MKALTSHPEATLPLITILLNPDTSVDNSLQANRLVAKRLGSSWHRRPLVKLHHRPAVSKSLTDTSQVCTLSLVLMCTG